MRYLSAFAVALAVCVVWASPASAQLPFPLFEKPKAKPKKPPKKDAAKKDAAAESAEPKEYKKPEPVPLPDGPAEPLSGPLALVKFDGIVNPGMGEYTVNSIARAEKTGAQAVLIELDTPGGLVTTTESIIQAILEADLPVIVYVTPSGAHAASAGTIITLAAHVAAMAPASRIGAAHPVTGGGQDPEEAGGKHMGRKVENDLSALIEGIATERNRNVEWAIDAVRQSVSVHAAKAVEIGVIDMVARSRADLLDKLDGWQLMVGTRKVELHTKGAEIVEYEQSIRERVVNFLANPGIAMILGMLGLIGIMVEIYHPGMIAPGVMGVLCVICSLIAVEQLPIDLGGGILVVAGIGLLIAELYTPTYGALGLLGVIGLTTGLLLVVDPSNPDFAIDRSFRLQWTDVLPIVLIMGLFVGYLSFFVLKSQRKPSVTGREGLIGARGFVLKPVGGGAGMVFVQGEYWKAKADRPLEEKTEIRVVEVDGLELTVEPIDDEAP